MSTVWECIPKDVDRTAIIIPAEKDKAALKVTYTDLAAHVSSLQQRLAEMGLDAGDAVAIVLPNTYSFIVAFLAATYQRLKAAPLNSAYKEAELDFYLSDLTPALILVPQGAFKRQDAAVLVAQGLGIAIAECHWESGRVVLDVASSDGLAFSRPALLADAEPDDVALVLHTSGTTGRPKAVPLSHRNLSRTMKNITATYELTSQDRTMLVMPLFHVHGLLASLLAPLHSGGSIIVPPSFHASTFWHDFNTYSANWYTAVPTIHTILLRSPLPFPIPAIRFIRSSSAALSPTTFHDLERAFQAPVLESYGMTEATHQIASNPLPSRGKRLPRSAGQAQGDVEILILDHSNKCLPAGTEGEICIRGENIMSGSISNPAANASSFTPDGFFRTGDQGHLSEEGYLTMTGRIKELINRAGEKISPTEIDQIVLGFEGVLEACAFAVPSEVYGEEIGVAVVTSDINLAAEDIQRFVAEKAVKYKVPKQIWIIPTIPKTATGKIQRLSVAKAMLAEDQPHFAPSSDETQVAARVVPLKKKLDGVNVDVVEVSSSASSASSTSVDDSETGARETERVEREKESDGDRGPRGSSGIDPWWQWIITGTAIASVAIGVIHARTGSMGSKVGTRMGVMARL